MSGRIKAGLFLACTAILLLSCTTPKTVSRPVPKKPSLSLFEEFEMHSKKIGGTFRIFVGLPSDYASSGEIRYPVLYRLDANWDLGDTFYDIRKQVESGNIEPVILVGICSVESLKGNFDIRQRDFIPARGAAAFADFLEKKVIPRIDSGYRTLAHADNRCLAGHSLGGLFVYYVMFTRSHLFRRFIAASSVIWMNKSEILEYEKAYADSHSDLPVSLYTSMSDSEGQVMLDQQLLMLDYLKGRKYPGLHLSSEIFKGLKHKKTAEPSYHNGLLFLFGK